MWESNKIGLCLPQLLAHQKFASMRLNDGAHAWLSARYQHDVGLLEQELADGRAFIVGEQATIADFALSGYLMSANEAKVSVPPQVQAWLTRMTALPGWRPPVELLS